MKHRWLPYYQPGQEQLGKHENKFLYPFTKPGGISYEYFNLTVKLFILLISHYKVEHPGEDLEDGQIMHKVNDDLTTV